MTIVETDDDKKHNPLTEKPSALFSNIRDLNSKIITGSVERISVTISNSKKSDKKILSAAHNYFPTFVSPRKASTIQDVKFKTFYEPPLIPETSQEVEPAFFAGSKREYNPPKRLPEELLFVDKEGKQVKMSNTRRLSSQLSIYTESPIAEEQLDESTDTIKDSVINNTITRDNT